MSRHDLTSEFQREYERIGYRSGEPWPFPKDVKDQQEILELMKRVPDGAGLSGWLEVLRERAAEGDEPASS